MDAAEYLSSLVAYPSISRDSNVDVNNYVESILDRAHFTVEKLEFVDARGVPKSSLVAKRGAGTGGLAYFAHTDVVPADNWHDDEHGPFQAVERDGRIYARGACDMKGSLACVLAAVDRLGDREPAGPLYVTCTADEEVGFGGAADVVKRSRFYREMVEAGTPGIIGEPTRLQVVHAHKGVVGFTAVSQGRAAHSSTREGINANLAMIPFLAELKAIHDETESDPAWQNAEFDPPTVTWNIGINDHTAAVNITPPQSVATVYFRPMPGTDVDALLNRARQAADMCGLDFRVNINGSSVYTAPDSPFVQEMLELSGREKARTVAYGTDGAMFTELDKLVVFGPGDIAQAHTRDEWIALDELDRGTDAYASLISRYCF